VAEKSTAPGQTFVDYYMHVKKGRGIWKWTNALVAYQRHFSMIANRPVLSIGEVGVQSGGSMLMWKGVYGNKTQLYGFDINPKCKKFEEPNVTITIGDQEDPAMWKTFFTAHPAGLDIMVDDGGHQPKQMFTTLKEVFPHIHPGGFLLIEDILNAYLLDSFFKPSATFISQQAWYGHVESVHLYPMVLVVRKSSPWPAGALQFSTKQVQVSNITAMWTAINSVEPGTNVILKNPAWGSFLQEHGLFSFFSNFIELHMGQFKDTPKGCRTTAEAKCTNAIFPRTHVQDRVSGVHIYPDHAVIEVPKKPPTIECVRRGTEWMSYSL
jgi:hypothetical protein